MAPRKKVTTEEAAKEVAEKKTTTRTRKTTSTSKTTKSTAAKTKKNEKEEVKAEEKKSAKKTKERVHNPADDLWTSDKVDEKVAEAEKEPLLTPSEYFDQVKSMKKEFDKESAIKLLELCEKKMKKFVITDQKIAAKEMVSRIKSLRRELELINLGYTTYVDRKDIERYIDVVTDNTVYAINMKNYDREIPDEIVDKILETQQYFDEFFIIFTDYTKTKEKKEKIKRKEKDPILFGNVFIDGYVSDRFYYIGDWIDDYCDLTLDKMLDEMSKKEKTDKATFLHEIVDDVEVLEKIFLGTNTLEKDKSVIDENKKSRDEKLKSAKTNKKKE